MFGLVAAEPPPSCPRRSEINDDPSKAKKLDALRKVLREDIPRPKIPTWLWVVLTVSPFIGFGLILILARELGGMLAMWCILKWTGASFFTGRWIIFRALFRNSPLGVWSMSAVACYLEVATAVFLIPNLDLLYRIPRLGPRLDHIQMASWEILHANAWLRRLTWFGLVIFVWFPVTGTGATGGTFFGRLLGLSRTSTTLGVTVGSALGCFTFGMAAAYMRKRAKHILAHPVITVAAVLLVLLFIFVLGKRLRGSH